MPVQRRAGGPARAARRAWSAGPRGVTLGSIPVTRAPEAGRRQSLVHHVLAGAVSAHFLLSVAATYHYERLETDEATIPARRALGEATYSTAQAPAQ
jgi:hypothetical protein